ncbi:zinc ABC transporter substrate-binding protein [soil metagenome]
MTRPWIVAAIVLALAGCTVGQPADSPGGASLTVVATTTVLADFARRVGGDRITVDALIPAGGDVHTFDPAPSDAARLSRADLLVMNGLGLDEWLVGLARDAGATETPVVELAEDLDGVVYLEGSDEHAEDEDEHAEDEDEEHRLNPHLWLDVSNARRYVDRLAEALSTADPAGTDTYRANATAYGEQRGQLDAWIWHQLATVAPADRRVVSFHDALPYFARAYDLEIVGVVVDSPGQEPSAAEVAVLIEAIRQADVRAVLAEAQFNDSLARVIADEANVAVVADLYTDSLGDAPTDTYEGAMRWNTEQILAGLR